MRTSIKLYNSNKYELGNNKYEKERILKNILKAEDEVNTADEVKNSLCLVAIAILSIAILILKILISL